MEIASLLKFCVVVRLPNEAEFEMDFEGVELSELVEAGSR